MARCDETRQRQHSTVTSVRHKTSGAMRCHVECYITTRHTPRLARGTGLCASGQLRDGVRTDGVITEVWRLPTVSFHAKMWQHVAACMVFAATCAYSGNKWQNIQDLWPFCNKHRLFGWHYLSNTTCLIRPHLFGASFVVSMIAYFATSFADFEETMH